MCVVCRLKDEEAERKIFFHVFFHSFSYYFRVNNMCVVCRSKEEEEAERAVAAPVPVSTDRRSAADGAAVLQLSAQACAEGHICFRDNQNYVT